MESDLSQIKDSLSLPSSLHVRDICKVIAVSGVTVAAVKGFSAAAIFNMAAFFITAFCGEFVDQLSF